jgi:hypothetical protein
MGYGEVAGLSPDGLGRPGGLCWGPSALGLFHSGQMKLDDAFLFPRALRQLCHL